MSFLIVDNGSTVPTGYLNPETPIFALSDGGTAGVASVIARAGGSVTVDPLGGIFMTTQATSFIGLDSFNNIAINTSNATPNATIEMIGQSTVTIQSTDGLAILESVTNDSFLSLGLDVELQARGALLGGGNVNVTNAGTIAFDTLGSGAITGLSTINGVAYNAPGTLPPTLTLSTLTVNGTGSITLDTNINNNVGSAPIFFKSVGHDTLQSGILTINKSEALDINNLSTSGLGVYAFSTLGAYQPLLAESYYVVGANNDGSTYGAAQISYTPTTSSITLTAPNVSVTSLTDVSTIGGGAALDITATTVAIVGGANVSLVDVGGAGFSVIGGVVQVNGVVGISSIMGLSSINGVAFPPVAAPRQATYYKSVAQNLVSGTTEVTFDSTGSWNNDGGYVTHSSGSKDFTVVQTGLYQLEFNASIAAAGVAWTGTKFVSIDITRSPTAEQAIIVQSATINSGTAYGQGVSATYYLVAGDVINLQIFNVFSSGTPTAVGLTNTIDLGTFFTWRYIA